MYWSGGCDEVVVHARFVCVRLLVLWYVAVNLLGWCSLLLLMLVLVLFFLAVVLGFYLLQCCCCISFAVLVLSVCVVAVAGATLC